MTTRPPCAMPRRVRRLPLARAFTLIEILIVVVILGVLAAIVVPRFAGAASEARASSVESTLAGVRSALAAHRSRAIIQGADPYPTVTALRTGDVLAHAEVPANPYTGLDEIQVVSRSQAEGRVVANESAFGWNYYVDNASDPPVAIFYCNSSTLTTVPDGAGGFLRASEL